MKDDTTRLVTTGGRPPGRVESTGVAVSNLDSSPATLTFTAIDRDGRWISDPGVTNQRSIELLGGSQLARLDTELFGPGLQAHDRLGWIRLESTTRRLAAFFLAFDADLSLLDGSDVGSSTVSEFVLPEVEAAGFTDVHLANPGTGAADALLELCGQDGSCPCSRGADSAGRRRSRGKLRVALSRHSTASH